jgi:rubrerythrin
VTDPDARPSAPARRSAAAASAEREPDTPPEVAEPVELPGDPVCWLRRVCAECGTFVETEPPVVCPQCGANLEAGR